MQKETPTHKSRKRNAELEDHRSPTEPKGKYLAVLALGALGVVYGDIGTSPLYAVRESFHGSYGLPVTPASILGIISLIFWSLVIVISVKYLIFVLRADNDGEGGILALTSLVTPASVRRGGGRWLLILIGLFGTALLYGDGMITPAISVLSAVEGLAVATPLFEPYILIITTGILVVLFAAQRSGTGGVGKVFGPVTLLWFATLTVLGLNQIVREPGVLAALNPLYGARFFAAYGLKGFFVLGSVFLVVTGGEALYADMGHFGKKPIRLAWFVVVLPALLINYFGQGALILRNPAAAENPFYRMVPGWALYPVVILATAATVIASQALISGVFSLTRQAVQLGYLPRLTIVHTSATERGQVYIASVNWALLAACIGLVYGFGSSSALAAAYGVAVTMTMVITTLLFYVVARERWRWPLGIAAGVSAFFLVIDLAFFGANLVKIPQGGWFPLVVALIVFTVLTTWKRGRNILAQRMSEASTPFTDFLLELRKSAPTRVVGTVVYMSGNPSTTPPALVTNLKHNHALHERVLFVAVKTGEVPRVKPGRRAKVTHLEDGFYQVVLHYGFMEEADVPAELAKLKIGGRPVNPAEVTYFLGRETLLATERPGMAIWREQLFVAMSRNAKTASEFFRLPPGQVVEIGAQIEL